MSSAVLEIRGLTKAFGSGPRRLQVLKGIDLTVQAGECAAIVGPSGAGKSTLLHVACGLMQPTGGSVCLEGREIFALSDQELAGIRNRRVGFVFQLHHLMPEFSALENVAMPALVAGNRTDNPWPRAKDLLRQVGLHDRESHRPGELSGGEQQRVAIARALMNQPALLLADEPTGDLDQTTASEIHELLMRFHREQGQTLVLVTHNPELSQMARRVITLRNGQITGEELRMEKGETGIGSGPSPVEKVEPKTESRPGGEQLPEMA